MSGGRVSHDHIGGCSITQLHEGGGGRREMAMIIVYVLKGHPLRVEGHWLLQLFHLNGIKHCKFRCSPQQDPHAQTYLAVSC